MPDVRDNDVPEFLANRGLAAIGSRMTIEELARKYGVNRWYDFWDVIYLPPAPLFRENVQPYFIQNDISHYLPPSTFYCDFDYFQDGHRNHELALERLTAALGQHPANTATNNTWSNTWTFGEISIQIITFIKDKSPAHNPLYERHPELWNQCRITVEHDWVQILSPTERMRLLSTSKTGVLPFHTKWAAPASFRRLLERGLLRRTPAQPNPFLWKDEEAGQVGWHAGNLAAFVQHDGCLGLRLLQIVPCRGGGSSRLFLELNNPFSDGHESVEIEVIRGEDTHTLDDIAAHLATFWELPQKAVESLND